MEAYKAMFMALLLTASLSSCERHSEQASSAPIAANPEDVEKSMEIGVYLPDPRSYVAAPDESIGLNQNGKGLAVGTHIESVSISDMHDSEYPLEEAWQEKPALIVFYRGGWCPFCNMQVRELSVFHHRLVEAGVQTVLISADAPDKSALLGAKYEIPFPVLSDPDLLAHRIFNVVLTLDEQTVATYKNDYGIDLEAWSGRDHRSFAVASAFIVDQQGMVKASHAPEDYRQRPSIEQLLQMIERAGVASK